MQGSVCYESSPSNLQFTEDLFVPEAQDGQVLVRVHSVAINERDVSGRDQRSTSPFIPGFEFAGTIVEIGGGCRRLSIGDEVWGLTPPQDGGACAEFVAVSEAAVALKPLDLDWDYAAATPLGATEAMRAVMGFAPSQWPEPKLDLFNKRVLVLGASCAEGVFAVQLSAQLGADVTAIVTPPAPAQDAALLSRFGAERVEVIAPTATILQAIAQECPGGFHLVLDCDGDEDNLAAQRRLLARKGRHVTRTGEGLAEVFVREGKRRRMLRLIKRVLLMRSGDNTTVDFPLYRYLDSVRFLAEKKVLVPVLDSRSPFILQDAGAALSQVEHRALRRQLPAYPVLSVVLFEGTTCLVTAKAPPIAFLPKGELVWYREKEGEAEREQFRIAYKARSDGVVPGETQFIVPDLSAVDCEWTPGMTVETNAGTGKSIVKVWPKSQALKLSQVQRAMDMQNSKPEPMTD